MADALKKCFKCESEKRRSDFYRHKHSADGLMGKCKACTRKDAREHRLANIERVREYDRSRGCRQTPEYTRNYRKSNPAKAKAHRAVAYAVQRGRMQAQSCEVCGDEKTHAHHDDYGKPLEVRWLCALHHREWHEKHGEAKVPKAA